MLKNPSAYLANLKNKRAPVRAKRVVKGVKKTISRATRQASAFHVAMARRAIEQGRSFYLVGKQNACHNCGGVKFFTTCICVKCDN